MSTCAFSPPATQDVLQLYGAWLLQNGQPKPSISSLFDQPEVNPDGSVDIYFGPRAPEGKAKNWIRTVPGKGHFVWIRLYGPLEPFFEQTWRPDDIVKI